MARKMVTEFGMSERVGAIKLGQSTGEVFLGRDMGHQRDYSEEVARIVDEEVRALIDAAHDEAWRRSSTRTATCSTTSCSSCSRRRRSTPRAGRALRAGRQARRSARPGSRRRRASSRPAAGADAGRDRARRTAPVARTVTCRRRCRPTAARGQDRRGRRGRRAPARRGAPVEQVIEVPDDRPGRPQREGLDVAIDQARAEAAVRELLLAIGEDPDREGLRRHPGRVARSYAEIFAGLAMTPADVLGTTFEIDHDEMVMVARHRALPHVRAPPRAVPRRGARRLHPRQGRPGHRPVQARPPRRGLRPAAAGAGAADHRRSPTRSSSTSSRAGVIVVIEAEHLCMSMRGIRKPGASTDHLGGARAAARRGHSSRGHGADAVRAGEHHRSPERAARPHDRPPARHVRRDRTLVMGVVNVTPDSFSDGGAVVRAGRRHRPRPRRAGGRRRHRRRRRRVDPARRRAPVGRGGAAPGRPGRRGARRRRAPWSRVDTMRAAVAARRGRGRRRHRQRRLAAAWPTPTWCRRGRREPACPTSRCTGAGTAPRCSRAPSTTTSSPTCAASSPRGVDALARRRASTRTSSCSTPGSASPRTPTTTGRCWRRCPCCTTSATRSCSAPPARRSSAGSAGADGRRRPAAERDVETAATSVMAAHGRACGACASTTSPRDRARPVGRARPRLGRTRPADGEGLDR